MIGAPRASATSSASSTTIPQPSPNTNPSRPASNGRLAVSGLSLRNDTAFIEAKPAIVSGVTDDSVPPLIITSATPRWMSLNALPMAWALEAQADWTL